MVATNNRYACQLQNRFGVIAAKNEDVRGSENENQNTNAELTASSIGAGCRRT
jgi:hypothetical protein